MRKKTSLFLALFFIFLFISHDALASFEFLDGRIRIKGRLEHFMMWGWHLRRSHIGRLITEDGPSTRPEQDYRDTNLVLNMSLVTMEGLFKLVDNEDWLVVISRR